LRKQEGEAKKNIRKGKIQRASSGNPPSFTEEKKTKSSNYGTAQGHQQETKKKKARERGSGKKSKEMTRVARKGEATPGGKEPVCLIGRQMKRKKTVQGVKAQKGLQTNGGEPIHRTFKKKRKTRGTCGEKQKGKSAPPPDEANNTSDQTREKG